MQYSGISAFIFKSNIHIRKNAYNYNSEICMAFIKVKEFIVQNNSEL